MTSELRRRMSHDLQLAGLSERTQDAYLRAVRMLADHFHTPPDRLSEAAKRDRRPKRDRSDTDNRRPITNLSRFPPPDR